MEIKGGAGVQDQGLISYGFGVHQMSSLVWFYPSVITATLQIIFYTHRYLFVDFIPSFSKLPKKKINYLDSSKHFAVTSVISICFQLSFLLF